jgi:hypothetical protein
VAGSSDLIGDAVLQVAELEPGQIVKKWINLVGPAPTQKGLDKRLGKNMAEQGWAPKLPIILVPGANSLSRRRTRVIKVKRDSHLACV